jgi:predicted nuclease of predicted toxin-antitoxin system
VRLLLDNNLPPRLVDVHASHEPGPSVVLVRRAIGRRVEQLAGLLLANLPQVDEDLRLGSIVVIGDDSLRIRRLPIG